jgi:histidinol-phosphate aminotransferase
MGVPLVKVPLRASDQAHDVRAMVAANPKAGLFYICNPNNPTGSLTPKEDIAWLLANKPAGSIVLLDEAYLHFSEAESGMDFVRSGADVVILRTFSKIFGMAGMRMGLSIGRPELLEKLMMADGHVLMGQLPVPALVCATASLKRPDLIAARRAHRAHAGNDGGVFARARVQGPAERGQHADGRLGRPAAPIKAAFEARGVVIGRSWTIWPTMSRITIGSPAEMQRFAQRWTRSCGPEFREALSLGDQKKGAEAPGPGSRA